MKTIFSATIRGMCLPIILLLLCSPKLSAQNRVAGTVLDVSHKPLAYANVLLLSARDSSLVRGSFTSEQGTFLFENVPAGTFVFGFSMLGFEQFYSQLLTLKEIPTETDLGTIVLKESAATLGEVKVVALRPFLEQKIDRTVVNVANSITNAGGNALEVLQRSPGVQVNRLTKTIALMGKEGVVIMINGKISRQPSDAIVQMLEGMNANNIDKIELIHTPPANFEAEGNAGIINIVLKNTGEEGFNGGYSVSGGYARGEKYGTSLNFNYRKNKLNWFGSYDYNFNRTPQVFTNYRGVQQGNDFLETESYSDRFYTPTAVQNARFGVDCQISKKTVVGVLGTFFNRNWFMDAVNDVKYSTNGTITSRLRMPNSETNQYQAFTGNINLTHQISKKQSLAVDADYINYNIHNPSHYTNQYLDAAGATTRQNELQISKETPIDIAVAKADYMLDINKNMRFEAGGKAAFMSFDNDVRVESRESQENWLVIPDLTSLYHLMENVAGAYATFSFKANSKTDIKTGMRYEFTRTNLGSVERPNVVDRRYGSWFPSLYVSRNLTEIQNLNFSYSRRIGRPPFSRLAPWLIFADPTTLQGGNPALQPSFTDAVKVDYGYKSWRLALSYSLENNPIRFLPKVDAATNRQVDSPENLDNIRNASVNLSFPLHPTKWWAMQNNVYTTAMETNLKLENQPIQLRNIIYGFNTTNTLTLPHQYTLEISGNYDSPGYWGVAKWKATGSANIGIQKELGEKWGKLRFNASDLFVSSNWFGTTSQPEVNLLVKSSFQFASRSFILTWTNKFGNNKLKSARQRQAAEELQRI